MWGSLALCLVGCLASIHAARNVPKAIMSITMCDAQLSNMKRGYKLRPSTAATNKKVEEASIRSSSSKRRTKRSPCTDNIVIGPRTFRSASGRCNNIANPEYGESFERFRRFVAARYEDDMCLTRATGVNGGLLPDPRSVSTAIHGATDAFEDLTVLIMQWGQFMDHDMTAAAVEQPPDGASCCSDATFQAGNPHPDTTTCDGACLPIRITDPAIDATCLENVRSRSIQNSADISATNKREQQNLLTAFIDASNVYGSEEERITELRDGSTAFMRVSANNLLPEGLPTDCIMSATSPFCFAAGDERVHVYAGLTGLHTIFVRLHNQIATILKAETTYSDNRIFYETRKIIGALLQEITYFEWLPNILNRRTLNRWGLLRQQYRREGYDSSINPSISGVFATAAFRFGHSFIPDQLVVAGVPVLTRDIFNNPSLIFATNGVRNVMEAVITQPALKRDRFMTGEVTNHLFETPAAVFDLASLNILRGRDHGIGTYNDAREACNLRRITSFDSRVFGADGATALQNTFSSVDDIDLFAGGMAESNMRGEGARLGPTFSCILGEQFNKLRYGDRFWYETNEPGIKFTQGQISAIRDYSLDQILCHTIDFVDVPKKIFAVPGPSNPRVACAGRKTLQAILAPWF